MRAEKNSAYSFRVSNRSRRTRITIYPDASVVVSAPKEVSAHQVEQFIAKKAHWILKKVAYFKRQHSLPSVFAKNNHFQDHKEQALLLARERVTYFNEKYNFVFKKIYIKNQKTRWGSCSKNGNLNFNYKIALLPQHFADYVIVHELCHLGEFNHSAKFWALVARTVPDYLDIRNMMKKETINVYAR
ncbi:MAG: SprT family zinc-dependent metalloprotease [Patescibacteria group bacterium]|jgi:hypothetical protein